MKLRWGSLACLPLRPFAVAALYIARLCRSHNDLRMGWPSGRCTCVEMMNFFNLKREFCIKNEGICI